MKPVSATLICGSLLPRKLVIRLNIEKIPPPVGRVLTDAIGFLMKMFTLPETM